MLINFGLVVAFLLCASPAWPQTSKPDVQSSPGMINGTIVDDTGAVIAGAKVTLSHDGVSPGTEVLSHEDGQFFFPNVSPGRYRLTVSASGFADHTLSGILNSGEVSINGHWQPNYSGILGSLASGGLSNLYYPAEDRKGVRLTFENAAIGIGGAAVGHLAQEFLFKRLTSHSRKSKPKKPDTPRAVDPQVIERTWQDFAPYRPLPGSRGYQPRRPVLTSNRTLPTRPGPDYDSPHGVRDRDAYLVVGFPEGDLPEQLFFDTQTGLLVRKETATATVLGDYTVQTDYDDYRDVAGVKIPYLVRTIGVSPADAVTTHIEKVEINPQLDAGAFIKPVSK